LFDIGNFAVILGGGQEATNVTKTNVEHRKKVLLGEFGSLKGNSWE